jgi:hypothetical protein
MYFLFSLNLGQELEAMWCNIRDPNGDSQIK